MSKLWFSFFSNSNFKGNEPAFYDKSLFDFTSLIEDNYEIIKKELIDYTKHHQLNSYFNESMVETKNSWKVISLCFWDIDFFDNQKKFQKTTSIIKSIPNLTSSSFTLLEPGSKIKPHCGDTNAIYRCHLGLQIPGMLPQCGFNSKNEWRNWEEGKLIIFNDANLHEAINLTDKIRLIFIFDIVRTEFIQQKKYISAVVIASMYLSVKKNKDFIYKRLPKKVISMVCKLMALRMLISPKYKTVVFSKIN